jgi:site-specific recombinase XerD
VQLLVGIAIWCLSCGDGDCRVVACGHQYRSRIVARSISATSVYNDIKALATAAALMGATDADRARVAALSPHWFRHRRASQLSKRLTPVHVAQYLGHTSIENTKAYSFYDDVDLARVVLAAAL